MKSSPEKLATSSSTQATMATPTPPPHKSGAVDLVF